MSVELINERGLLLYGCGKMGSAMLSGWLEQGVRADAVSVKDPYPSKWLQGLADRGLKLNQDLLDPPAVCILAVKPQMIASAAELQILATGQTIFLSVAAGATLANLANILGGEAPIIRVMPNTPAAIGQGITALIGNDYASDAHMTMAEMLMGCVGQTIFLEDESQMDAVTAVSGSGPAYVFHMIEALAAAGEAEGLPTEIALELAKATVAGAGALAMSVPESPAQLRSNVTSPGGTTAAALEILMDETNGLRPLMSQAVNAAANRSRELAQG